MDVRTIAQLARDRSVIIATATTEQKNAALKAMAYKLAFRRREILHANEADLAEARW